MSRPYLPTADYHRCKMRLRLRRVVTDIQDHPYDVSALAIHPRQTLQLTSTAHPIPIDQGREISPPQGDPTRLRSPDKSQLCYRPRGGSSFTGKSLPFDIIKPFHIMLCLDNHFTVYMARRDTDYSSSTHNHQAHPQPSSFYLSRSPPCRPRHSQRPSQQ